MNRSGFLVAFSEVESLMEQGIEEVQHAVVTAKAEEDVRGSKMVACCQMKRGTAIDNKTLRTRCFDIMMRHMVPDEVIMMKEIPRLPNGKFDRKKLTHLI
jgi:acyl-coenzyme A synthetase/AMP-(fatty) acid ligase